VSCGVCDASESARRQIIFVFVRPNFTALTNRVTRAAPAFRDTKENQASIPHSHPPSARCHHCFIIFSS